MSHYTLSIRPVSGGVRKFAVLTQEAAVSACWCSGELACQSDQTWGADVWRRISDRGYVCRLDDGGSSEAVEFAHPPTAAEIGQECEDWVTDGEWGDDGVAIDVSWSVTDEDGDEVDSGCEVVEVAPDHARLIYAVVGNDGCGTAPDDHDWTSDGEGGLRENPGVWATGGTSMVFYSHCRRCGLHRTERHTGSQHNPGEHDTVKYRLLDDEEIADHIANGDMDEAGE